MCIQYFKNIKKIVFLALTLSLILISFKSILNKCPEDIVQHDAILKKYG
jgi:hypothetical protein